MSKFGVEGGANALRDPARGDRVRDVRRGWGSEVGGGALFG